MNSLLLSGSVNHILHNGSPLGSRHLIRRGVPPPPTWSSQSSRSPVFLRRHRPLSSAPHWQPCPISDHRHWQCHQDNNPNTTARIPIRRSFSTTPATPHATRVLLPTLGQNGTLSIRQDDSLAVPLLAEVHILPRWRDDSFIEIVPLSPPLSPGLVDDATIPDSKDVTIFDEATTRTFGQWQFTLHADGIATSLGRVGSHVEIRPHAPNTNDENHTAAAPPVKLVATVPEKCNLDICAPRSDIRIHGKVEGDVHLAGRSIRATKLRGHRVILSAATPPEEKRVDQENDNDSSDRPGGIVHATHAIEARTVDIVAAKRIRVKMINGSDVALNVALPPEWTNEEKETQRRRLDDDDEGAVVDIGSLYVSTSGSNNGPENEARLTIDASSSTSPPTSSGLARVKSHHGHVSVHAIVGEKGTTSEAPSHPLVDLGGVNGSCDVLVESSSESKLECVPQKDTVVAARVHFDSLTPRSISAITARARVGNVHLTMDRKLEAEARLLSLAEAAGVAWPGDVEAWDLAGEGIDDDQEEKDDNYDGKHGNGDVKSLLLELDAMSSKNDNKRSYNRDDQTAISIETDAYIGTWGLEPFRSNDTHEDHVSDNRNQTLRTVQYTQGTVKNRSGEPDSRFDVRSRGKIDVDGAASQALHGFRSKSKYNDDDEASDPDADSSLPLVAVATDGRIRLETLSWLGSIARRYGLEESKRSGLGRQASRAPRLEGK